MPDELKIPYKYGIQSQFSQFKLNNIFDRNVGTDDAIDAVALKGILNDFLGYLSDQYRQNWLEVERHANRNIVSGGSSVFDATIDPGLPNDAATHRYVNLTTLLSNESWSTDLVFTVGVVNRPGTIIVEPADGTPDIPGHLALVCFGAQDASFKWGQGSAASSSRVVWDSNGTRFQGAITRAVYLQGMEVMNRGSARQDVFDGTQPVHMHDCIFEGFNGSNTRKLTCITEGNVRATECLFVGHVFQVDVEASDCHYTWCNDNSSVVIFNGDTLWDGGTLCGVFGGGGTTLTLNNSSTKNVYVRFARCVSTHVTGSAGGGTVTLNVANGSATIDMPPQGAGVAVNLTVQANAGDVIARGRYLGITDSGQSNPQLRHYDVTASGVVDITGPAQVKVQFAGTGGRFIMRGARIQAEAHGTLGATGTFLTLTGADDCYVVAAATGAGASSKYYAIDANSDRSIVIALGLNTGAFGVASTNASGSTIVRDETTL